MDLLQIGKKQFVQLFFVSFFLFCGCGPVTDTKVIPSVVESPQASTKVAGVVGIQEKKTEGPVESIKKKAQDGDPESQNRLADMYHSGEGVEQDYKEAAKWYEKAAFQGHAEAQDSLAVMYSKGLGLEQNYEKAAEWYEKAAKQGIPRAQYNLAICTIKEEE